MFRTLKGTDGRVLTKWLKISLVVIALSFGLFVRLHDPAKSIIWDDEAVTLLFASGHDFVDVTNLNAHWPATAGEFVRRTTVPAPDRTLQKIVRSSYEREPQVSPLYYAIVSLVLPTQGSPVARARLLNAWITVLFMLVFFLLCHELFPNPAAKWVGASLVALSPGQVYWAYEVRHYGPWMAAMALSTYALLCALKRGRSGWLFYSLALASTLHLHVLSFSAALAHAFVAWREGKTKIWLRSLAGAAVLYIPSAYWLIVRYTHVRRATVHISHGSWSDVYAGLSFPLLRQHFMSWLPNESLTGSWALDERLYQLVVGVVLVGFVALWRWGSGRQKDVIFALIFAQLVAVGAIDLVAGTHLLISWRYPCCSTLGMLLLLTFVFQPVGRRLWPWLIFAPLMLIAALTSWYYATSPCPFPKYALRAHCSASELLNRAAKPELFVWQDANAVRALVQSIPAETSLTKLESFEDLERASTSARHGRAVLCTMGTATGDLDFQRRVVEYGWTTLDNSDVCWRYLGVPKREQHDQAR